MKLEIRTYPDAVLKKKALPVEKIDQGILKLIAEMKVILGQEQPGRVRGVGLAAPQVGILKRVIVINTGQELKGFVNPEIIKKSRRHVTDKEGCLSFPGLWLEIKRAKEVEAKALDEKGQEQTFRAAGLLARVFQHEIDHLEGILFFERLGFLQRMKMSNF